MSSIIPFLPEGMRLRDSVFEPDEIKTMSAAFDEVCEALKLQHGSPATRTIAARIIDLVRGGERSPKRLRDTVLQEESSAKGAPKDASAGALNIKSGPG
jgi:hypothetical protein